MAAAHSFQPTLFLLESDLDAPDQLGRASVSEIYVKQILTKASGSVAQGGYDYTLNPYVGCGFSCSYCFASFFQPDQDRYDNWGKWIEIKANAVDVLKAKKDLRGKKIFMSSATDPYQPLEAKVELTRRLVEAMSDPLRQPRVVVQTRGPLVTRDIDLLKRFKHLRVNMSITTDSEEVRKKFEPSCASIERRLEAVKELRMAGIRASIAAVPMLPLENPERFAKMMKDTGALFFSAYPFRITDRPFAASTRDGALKLAADMGWDKAAFASAAAELKRYLPELNEGERGFSPE